MAAWQAHQGEVFNISCLPARASLVTLGADCKVCDRNTVSSRACSNCQWSSDAGVENICKWSDDARQQLRSSLQRVRPVRVREAGWRQTGADGSRQPRGVQLRRASLRHVRKPQRLNHLHHRPGLCHCPSYAIPMTNNYSLAMSCFRVHQSTKPSARCCWADIGLRWRALIGRHRVTRRSA